MIPSMLNFGKFREDKVCVPELQVSDAQARRTYRTFLHAEAFLSADELVAEVAGAVPTAGHGAELRVPSGFRNP